MADVARWRHLLLGVRGRATAAVVAVTTVAALLGSWALVAALGGSLLDGAVSTAETRAEEVAAALEESSPQSLALPEEDEGAVYVLDGDRVVARSDDAAPRPPVVPDDDPVTDAHEDGDDDRLVVVAEDAEPYTVVVTRSADDVAESQQALAGALAVGVPLLIALAGLATWVLVGRSLAPVEAIRAEVERIGGDDLARRVPEPGARDEVGDLAVTMNAMLGRLEAARERQRRLVADASHELRSPATALRQHAEVALQHPDRTSVDGLARTTLAEGRRLEQLVEQMLWLARTDETTDAVRRRPVDLDDLVLEEAVRTRATSAHTVDTSQVSGGQVTGDPLMLRRLVANLLDNADTHAASRITVSLREDEQHVVLTVDDDGPGIPAAQRERVLERFVRLDESRSRERGGAGLGLAIVRGVAEAHGGRVRVDESSTGGARLEVVLPLAHPA